MGWRLALPLAATLLQAALSEPAFELTLVDPEATGYATFQSHNQKVVANDHGYFMTYIRTRDEPFMAQNWRLLRSTDEGKSFQVVYEATHATNPPPIETDAGGNVYLVRTDFQDGNAYLYRFDAAKDYRDPAVSVIPGGAAGKVALALDPEASCLYFAAHNNEFYRLGLDGAVLDRVTLLRAGAHALLQYPSLRLAADGTLHYAWTTQRHERYLYRGIHHAMRARNSVSWRAMGGAELTPPIIADDSGPAPMINTPEEVEVHTWLASFLIKGGKAHFLYLRQSDPPRQIHVRRDLATGVEERRSELPDFLSLSGLLVSRDERAESPLYSVSSKFGRLVALVSRDNGDTWSTWAEHDGGFNEYSLGGCNTITRDGWILGSFTDQKGTNGPGEQWSRVYFFRLRVD